MVWPKPSKVLLKLAIDVKATFALSMLLPTA